MSPQAREQEKLMDHTKINLDIQERRIGMFETAKRMEMLPFSGIRVMMEKAEPDVQEMVKEYARRRDYMVSAINSMDGVSCKTPGGAFYVFMNIKSFGMSSADMANYLLEEAKIATVPGSAFGSQGEGYVRFSYACSYERIVEGMERMRKALAKLPKKA